MKDADVIVLGAGAAGLSAARELIRAGARVLVLEAGVRAGGRILTEHVKGWHQPLELGAEFVHGDPRHLSNDLEEANLSLSSSEEVHFKGQRGDISRASEIEAVEGLLASTQAFDDDPSAMAVLDRLGLDVENARWFTHFVESFHAAPLERVSFRALTAQAEGASSRYRIDQGYGALVAHWVRDIEARGGRIRYGTVARRVTGDVHGIRVETAGQSFRADAAVVALPVGVLVGAPNRAAIEFEPEPVALRAALASLEMGHALRVVLRFREPTWLHEALPPGAFLHTLDAPVPTLWTGLSRDQPQLTGWCGGARAARMEQSGDLRRPVFESVARALGISVAELEVLLAGVHCHDFGNDPRARGAYPFRRAGSLDRMATPSTAGEPAVLGTPPLVFAGDFLNPQELGTVGAAIASGRDARILLDSPRAAVQNGPRG